MSLLGESTAHWVSPSPAARDERQPKILRWLGDLLSTNYFRYRLNSSSLATGSVPDNKGRVICYWFVNCAWRYLTEKFKSSVITILVVEELVLICDGKGTQIRAVFSERRTVGECAVRAWFFQIIISLQFTLLTTKLRYSDSNPKCRNVTSHLVSFGYYQFKI